MKIHPNKYIYHISGCLAFLLIPLLLAPRPPEEAGGFFLPPTIRDVIANVLMLMFFYFNYYVLIGKLYFRKRYLNYFAVVIFAFLVILVVPSLLTGQTFSIHGHHGVNVPKDALPGIPLKPDDSFLQEVGHHIYLFGVVLLFSILLQVNSRLLKAEKERIVAELAHLKAQIHPHFLFNTLNSIYALSVTKDDKAPDSIVKLSEFMRYLLKDANENEVFLAKEIEYISNYLELQLSRLRDSVRLNYELSGNADGKKIAPLLLFSFIENAFKHGVSPEEDSQIDARIHITQHSVELLVRNNKVQIHNKEHSTRIGISNTRERLMLLYPDKHKLEIENEKDYFLVTLLIELS